MCRLIAATRNETLRHQLLLHQTSSSTAKINALACECDQFQQLILTLHFMLRKYRILPQTLKAALALSKRAPGRVISH